MFDKRQKEVQAAINMSIISDPEEILTEFLRTRVTDPRGRYTSDSDDFVATSGQTDFVLTPATIGDLVRSIKSVIVDGVSKKKWQDYSIDLSNKTITLFTGAVIGDVVEITYYSSGTGEEWIFPDRPISKLGQAKFPRISVEIIDIGSNRGGNYIAPLNDDIGFSLMVHVKDNYVYTLSGKKYSKQDLANYLGRQVKKAFSDYINDLYPKLFDYSGTAWGPLPFSEDSQVYNHVQDIRLSGVDSGE